MKKAVCFIVSIVLIALCILPVFARDYQNSRFAFKIAYPDAWEKYKNPPPANNDGVSFSFPGGANFSASGGFNALGNTLDQEVDFRVGEDGKVLQRKKITMDKQPGVLVVYTTGNIKHMMAVTLRNNGETVYSLYYTAPAKVFPNHLQQVEKVFGTFKVIGSPM